MTRVLLIWRLFVFLFVFWPFGFRFRIRLREPQSRKRDNDPSKHFDIYIEAGFQIATFQGPLCHEPVEGLAYFVESVAVDPEALEQERRKCYFIPHFHSSLGIPLFACFFLSRLFRCSSHADMFDTSSQQNAAGGRRADIISQGCLSERSAGLVAKVDVGNVQLRYPSYKYVYLSIHSSINLSLVFT